MGSLHVALLEPGFRRLARFSKRLEEPSVQAPVPEHSVEALVVTVLPRAAWLDESDADDPVLDPVLDFLRDELEGSTGYIFLAMMVVTSFKFGRKHLNAKQWKLLHKSGLYFLWAYPFSVYWWNLSYYENPQPIDYVSYWGGFLAFALRIAAWGKKRRQVAFKTTPESSAPFAFKMFGGALIAFGVFVASTGLQWQKPVTDFLLAPGWSANLVLWLPYWPFEPYLSLFIIGLGTVLVTKTRA